MALARRRTSSTVTILLASRRRSMSGSTAFPSTFPSPRRAVEAWSASRPAATPRRGRSPVACRPLHLLPAERRFLPALPLLPALPFPPVPPPRPHWRRDAWLPPPPSPESPPPPALQAARPGGWGSS